MKTLDREASNSEILSAVREWVALLADERYKDAYVYLYHNSDDPWTPELMKKVISNYGGYEPHWSGKTFRVTPLRDEDIADEDPDNPDNVMRFDDDVLIAHVIYHLPLNGEWSDLAAIFDVVAIDGGAALRLETFRVM